MWFEWLIAQELLRRSSIRGDDLLAPQSFWQNKDHEIDYVDSALSYIEVKRGKCSPLEFSWFHKQFSGEKLTVINASRFKTDMLNGITLEDFLLTET